MDKSFFVGDISSTADDPEFYYRTYTVQTSASMGFPGVGTGSDLDRIRWEVTEGMLLARKAYEIASGRDGMGLQPGESLYKDRNGNQLRKAQNGTIVAAYKIVSHFDVRRDYNPTTGEETNVVVENSSDRPWYQRQYMRVDWSKNLQATPLWNELDSTKIEAATYEVNDPNDEDAPHFEPEDGYLDVTGKATYAPEMTEFYGWSLPECLITSFLTGSSSYECDSQEFKYRTAVWKIKPDHDFEPFANNTAVRDVVGNSGSIHDRQGWDPQYGYTDKLAQQWMMIHNTWWKSHQPASEATACVTNVDDNKDGTADECTNDKTGYSGSSGSQCDTVMQLCTLPYRDRVVKPISYWANREIAEQHPELLSPEDDSARGAFEDLIYSWNQLISVALATAREVECRRTGDGDRATCHSNFFSSTEDPSTKQMLSYGAWLIHVPTETNPAVTFCHNPVRESDLHSFKATDPHTGEEKEITICGKTGDTARFGDVRKNFVFYHANESRSPYGGIVDWSADPLTGEFIGATATTMGRSATRAAAMQRDVLQLAMGDTTLDDITNGAPSDVYVKSLKAPVSPPVSSAEVKARVESILETQKFVAGGAPAAAKPSLARLADRLKTQTTADLEVRAMKQFDTLAQRVSGQASSIVDNSWLLHTTGLNASVPMNGVLGQFAANKQIDLSPLGMMDPLKRSISRADFESKMSDRGACFMGQEAGGQVAGSVQFYSLAGYFKKKYASLSKKDRGDAIYADLVKDGVKGIALHEIGHSFGLRHNFASSWDSPNYNPQYWQLRTNDGDSKAMGSCDGKVRTTGDSDTCMGPRYLDPETTDESGLGAESRPSIGYFANTSTMEYQIERSSETVGLGPYDQFAMKALYGRVLETFDDKRFSDSEAAAFRFKNYSQLIDGDLIIEGSGIQNKHYTEVARLMKIFDAKRDCRAATAEEKQYGAWRIVHGKVCAPISKDHYSWNDFETSSVWPEEDPDNSLVGTRWHAVIGSGKNAKSYVRWPYRYGEQYRSSYIHTNMDDSGADIYEVTTNYIRKFQVNYPFTYFRRKNREYNYWGIANSVGSRTFERLRSYHWNIAKDVMDAPSADLLDDNATRPSAMAQKALFDFFVNVILMPEPGIYVDASRISATAQGVDSGKFYDTRSFDVARLDSQKVPYFNVQIGEGRYIGDDFDNLTGGSWDYSQFVNHVGFDAEKTLAILALTDSRPVLSTISRENVLDGRSSKVSFRTDLPRAVDRLLAGLLAGDWSTVGLAKAGSGAGDLIVRDLSPSTMPARAADDFVLHPNVGYSQQVSMAIYAALFSRVNTDMTLVNKMRVWRDGDNGALTVPEAATVKFVDPETNITYIAAKFGDDNVGGKTVDAGIGSRMLQHAQALSTAAYNPSGPGVTVPTVKDAVRHEELRGYVGFLDMVREVCRRLDSPLGSSDD